MHFLTRDVTSETPLAYPRASRRLRRCRRNGADNGFRIEVKGGGIINVYDTGTVLV